MRRATHGVNFVDGESNTESGLFYWLVANSNRIAVGDIAGNKDRDGYIRIGINGNNYPAHRLAWLYMTGSFPTKQLDHINHIRDDNRWLNMREVDNRENSRNHSISKNNTL